MKSPKEHAQEIADKLAGTCDTLHQALDAAGLERFEDHEEFLEELDDLVFCCEDCGWWHYHDEMAETDGLVCIYCADEEDDA